MITTVGPLVTHKALATASYTFTPQEPYAAKVTRITMTGVSAADTWILSVNGKELARFYEQTLGDQQLLSATDANYPKTYNIFSYMDARLGIDFSYPVPQGASLTLTSVGGATADVLTEYCEYYAQELTTGMLNHPNGNHFIVPYFAYIAASKSAIGEYDFDTEVKPLWMPSVFIEGGLVAGWRMKILALFAQGVGVNTFSGSADHQSVTDHLYLIKSGQRMFTRDAADGLPIVGKASAAGSANTVYDSRLGALHAFQKDPPWDVDIFDPPLEYKTGDVYEWGLGVTGSLTGGADYSKAIVVAIMDVMQTGVSV